MAAKSNHDILWIAILGGGGFVGWRLWQAHEIAAAGGNVSTGGFSFPPLTSMLTGPSPAIDTSLVPGQTAPIYSSNPSLMYPGVIGNCMAKKGNTWSAAQCRTRLNALIAAYNNAAQAIANLKANTNNPAAAGIPAAQAALAQYDIAITNEQAQLAQAPVGSQAYTALATHIASMQQDRSEIATRITSATNPVDQSAGINAWQSQMAANDTDYFNLTGQHLSVGMGTV